MMSFGCCKHVLKVYVNLMDKKVIKTSCIHIHLKVDFLSNAPLESCKLCTAVLRTDRGIRTYGSSKFPLWGAKVYLAHGLLLLFRSNRNWVAISTCMLCEKLWTVCACLNFRGKLRIFYGETLFFLFPYSRVALKLA